MDSGDTLFVGREEATFLVVGLDPGTGKVDDLVRPLRLATYQIEQDLRAVIGLEDVSCREKARIRVLPGGPSYERRRSTTRTVRGP